MFNLFDKIKANIKFSKTGKGQVLGSSNTNSNQNLQQKNTNTNKAEPPESTKSTPPEENTEITSVDQNKTYTFLKCHKCNLKVEYKNYLKHSIDCFGNIENIDQVDFELLFRAFHTFNSTESVNDAISLVKRYLTNIINDPTNPKFHRIKLSNKQLIEKFLDLKLGLTIFYAFGFTLCKNVDKCTQSDATTKTNDILETSREQSYQSHYYSVNTLLNNDNLKLEDEILLFSNQSNRFDSNTLQGRLELLEKCKQTKLLLNQLYSRNIKIITKSAIQTIVKTGGDTKNNNIEHAKDDDDDFTISRSDIMREYKNMKDKIQRETSFTSSKQREELKLTNKLFTLDNFKISTIKIKLTDSLTIQAEFLPTETIFQLYNFIDCHASYTKSNSTSGQQFDFKLMIKDPKQRTMEPTDSKTLIQENLFPTAIIYFYSPNKNIKFNFN